MKNIKIKTLTAKGYDILWDLLIDYKIKYSVPEEDVILIKQIDRKFLRYLLSNIKDIKIILFIFIKLNFTIHWLFIKNF